MPTRMWLVCVITYKDPLSQIHLGFFPFLNTKDKDALGRVTISIQTFGFVGYPLNDQCSPSQAENFFLLLMPYDSHGRMCFLSCTEDRQMAKSQACLLLVVQSLAHFIFLNFITELRE